MKTTAIAATLAGGLNSITVADEAGCTEPNADHDTVQTQLVQLWLTSEVDRALASRNPIRNRGQ